MTTDLCALWLVFGVCVALVLAKVVGPVIARWFYGDVQEGGNSMADERIQQIKGRLLPLRFYPISDLSALEAALISDAAHLLAERERLLKVVDAARVLVEKASTWRDGPGKGGQWSMDVEVMTHEELIKATSDCEEALRKLDGEG